MPWDGLITTCLITKAYWQKTGPEYRFRFEMMVALELCPVMPELQSAILQNDPRQRALGEARLASLAARRSSNPHTESKRGLPGQNGRRRGCTGDTGSVNDALAMTKSALSSCSQWINR